MPAAAFPSPITSTLRRVPQHCLSVLPDRLQHPGGATKLRQGLPCGRRKAGPPYRSRIPFSAHAVHSSLGPPYRQRTSPAPAAAPARQGNPQAMPAQDRPEPAMPQTLPLPRARPRRPPRRCPRHTPDPGEPAGTGAPTGRQEAGGPAWRWSRSITQRGGIASHGSVQQLHELGGGQACLPEDGAQGASLDSAVLGSGGLGLG